ncbi:MAG: chromosome segregation protein SMC [Elusimicrobia bacterium]|nr:chromosome segregation protein SMC [Elusimicrobiota bacterium]
MYLKEVEIVGFKSFVNKTRIELKPGTTGIVGPNGVGKSNIFDAIKWCLGEMSWKSLRSPAMVEVIFSGTSRRDPLNLAEVTLTFDNPDRLLPIDYAEVSVSRKIYRSGESGYFLNRTQCRLRDIRELFLDTGIGEEGYSIMDQGKVDFILLAKPEDRRTLFEEAAGVAKYKAKREEALRKLERVDADVLRLQDSLSMIQEQIRKLDLAARKAKQYQKLQQELQNLEIGRILKEAEELKKQLDQEKALWESMAESLSKNQTALDTKEANLSALRIELLNQEKEALGLNQKLSEIKLEISRCEGELNFSEKTAAQLQERIQQTHQEKDQEQASLQTLRPRLEQARRELADFQQDFSHIQESFQGRQEELNRLQKELSETESELQAQERQLLEQQEKILHLQNALAQSHSEINQKQYHIHQADKDHRKSLDRLQALQMEEQRFEQELQAQLQQSSQKESEIQKLTERKQELEGQKETLHGSLLSCKEKKAQALAQIQALHAKSEEDPQQLGVRTLLAHRQEFPGIHGMLSHLLEVPSGESPAVEEALGPWLNSLICDSSQTAQEAIRFLQDSQKGRAQFLILDRIPAQPPPDLRMLYGGKKLLSLLRYPAFLENLLSHLLRDVFLKEGSLFAPFWIAGGQTHSAEARRNAFQKLQKLEQEVSQLKNQEELEDQSAGQIQRLLLEVSRLQEQARMDWQNELVTQKALENQLQQKKEERDPLRQEVQLIEQDLQAQLAELSQKKESAEETLREKARLAATMETVKSQKEELQKLLGRLRGEQVQKSTELAESKAHFSHHQDRLKLLEDQCRSLQQETERAGGSIAERTALLQELEAKRKQEIGRSEDAKKLLAELHQKQNLQEEDSRSLLGGLEHKREQTQQLEEQLRQTKATWQKLQQETHRAEIQVRQMESRRENLSQQLQSLYQMTLEEARSQYAPQEVPDEEIQNRKKRLAHMGPVNLAAPEEYDALEVREKFLNGQMEDLKKAEENLRQAISKINATTRENFRHSFEQVQAYFRKIYASLFEGGEADLVLTEPHNILETGVEIVAQPPGKKLQSISLLSGGERALTAIALLFAFFSVRPSPFCLLDEVDAALDEANVERFVALLRGFAEKNQFVIVSHNKRTMEAAEILYGISMEEPGVSQVISVELKKPAGSKEKIPASRSPSQE